MTNASNNNEYPPLPPSQAQPISVSIPPLLSPRRHPSVINRELLETQKGDIENALAAEASKRSAAEDLAQRLENSTALAQRELEVCQTVCNPCTVDNAPTPPPWPIVAYQAPNV